MIKIFFSLSLWFCFTYAFAQRTHNPNDQIRSINWDAIGSVTYVLTEKNELSPIYTELILRFENKSFDLLGYLIPIKSKLKHERFLLASLPISQCFFCGKNGVPSMILVEMKNPISFTDKPIRLKGILKLPRGSNQTVITLADAELIPDQRY
ncbi:hypothetical protein [Pedobacter sp. Hv1]|uniref:hypothetical protein n=1 Tax=Pedobacter sp. Hv1 TaxID=1740090 RepID=UPI0006D8CB33|nr:hypothetical protein [Pedobacter sp. Hv1]KQC01741.1 hypothetical protein AQF98_05050 [Pedobacter sp. Hv1]